MIIFCFVFSGSAVSGKPGTKLTFNCTRAGNRPWYHNIPSGRAVTAIACHPLDERVHTILLYSGDLNTGLVRFQMVQSYLIADWSGILMPFEYRSIFSLIFRPPFEYWTSEYWTSKNLLFRWFRYSDSF